MVEIKPNDYNKGTVVKHYLDNGNYDFAFVIGDDATDEDMFRVSPKKVWSVCVGRAVTLARYRLSSQTEVLPFLNMITA